MGQSRNVDFAAVCQRKLNVATPLSVACEELVEGWLITPSMAGRNALNCVDNR